MKKQILTKQKGNRGITLIALVITIIVLLILSGISIAILTGENGILTKANDAKTQTRGASVEEARDLWKINQETDNYTESGIAQTLEELIADLINQKLLTEDEKDQILGNSSKGIEATGQVTIGSRTIIFKEKELTDYVKIGDYVDYQPNEVTTPYDKFGETYTGYANATDIGQDSDLQWRVLNINSNGTIDLISDRPTSKTVYFQGARGYSNGVAILNDYCKTMYSNASKKAVARSLNIEDIQDKMKIDEATGKKAYESYTSGTRTVYKTGTYSYSSNKWYPLKWKEDNGIVGESEPKTPTSSDIKSYASEDDAKMQETSGNLTVTQTYWHLDASTMSSNFETADARDTNKKDSMYYELLCNNGSSYYWLASRYVNAHDSSYANVGLRRVNYGNVDATSMFNSNSSTFSGYYFVCPIVSLPSDVIDLNTNYETIGKWNLNS